MAMLDSAKAITFVVTRDRARAKAFYRETVGFPLTHDDDFTSVFDLNGTMLRISTVENHIAAQHTVLGWEVSDIADTVRALRGMGVVFTIYDGFGQDELCIWTSPDNTAKVAWFKDLDGNVLSLTQF